jgi:hypothetical protein
MNNPWKLATLGLALVGVTSVSTGVTTAYLLRPNTTDMTAAAPAYAAPAPAVTRAVMTTQAPVATRPVAQPAVVTQPAVVRPVAVQTVANDCATGGQRAMKIAKPGLIGALGGAGLGAIGGALAGGGSGAGKGALIGGLAGTTLGAGYGAYKTKQECGTIFGSNTPGFAGNTLQAAVPAIAPQAALRAVPGAGEGITVYNAR